jgi:hypothetical protein
MALVVSHGSLDPLAGSIPGERLSLSRGSDNPGLSPKGHPHIYLDPSELNTTVFELQCDQAYLDIINQALGQSAVIDTPTGSIASERSGQELRFSEARLVVQEQEALADYNSVLARIALFTRRPEYLRRLSKAIVATKRAHPKTNIPFAFMNVLPSSALSTTITDASGSFPRGSLRNSSRFGVKSYQSDADYIRICERQGHSQAVLGVSSDHGGVDTLINIALTKAVTPFIANSFGMPEDSNVSRDTLAGAHGPFFIIARQDCHCYSTDTPSGGFLYKIPPREHAVYLVPHGNARCQMDDKLASLVRQNLITSSHKEAVMEKVKTYAEYAESLE